MCCYRYRVEVFAYSRTNFYYNEDAPLYLLMVYAKAQAENLSPGGKKAVRALAEALKERYKTKGGRNV